MPKRRRRRRVALNWGPILFLASVANITAGLFFSPLTAIRKVRVVGASPSDQARIQTILDDERGKPAVQVSPRLVETRALEASEVRTAQFGRNLFGHAELTISLRRPVATVNGAPGMAMDPTGNLFSTKADLSALPSVYPPQGDDWKLECALVGTWARGRMAELSESLKTTFQNDALTLHDDPSSGVFFTIGDRVRVILGDWSDLQVKLRTLRGLLSKDGELLNESSEINLTAPDHPTRIKRTDTP
ncbi:MAG: hypothetical protein JST35_00780 [Armatimonadetes bacterium]|nr:hypothetical protein [Armatimonadota bacterium]